MKRRGLFAMIAGAVGIKLAPKPAYDSMSIMSYPVPHVFPWPPILQRVQFIPPVTDGQSIVNSIFEVEAKKLTGMIDKHDGWPVGPAQRAIREFGRPFPDGLGFNFKTVEKPKA